MSEVIAAENLDELTGASAVAFQITDLKKVAAKILKAANDAAAKKIADAAKTAAEQEKAGYAAGLKKGEIDGAKKGETAGHAAGEKAARDEFVKNTTSVAAALKAALAELNRRKTQLQSDAETDLTHLALALARRIVRHELSVNPQAILPIIHDAIGLCNNRSDLTLRLNPEDYAAVENEIPILQGVFNDLQRVNLIADATVERGGVLLTNRQGAVDLQIAQQFAALERALTGQIGSPFDDKKIGELAVRNHSENPPENIAAKLAEEKNNNAPENAEPEIIVSEKTPPAITPENSSKIAASATLPSDESIIVDDHSANNSATPEISTPESPAPFPSAPAVSPLSNQFLDKPVNVRNENSPPLNATFSTSPINAAKKKAGALGGINSLNDLVNPADPQIESAISAALSKT